jgi:hypothetical protein
MPDVYSVLEGTASPEWVLITNKLHFNYKVKLASHTPQCVIEWKPVSSFITANININAYSQYNIVHVILYLNTC